MNGSKGKVFLLSSEGVGYGDNTLGYQVLAAMLESLNKRPQKPAAIICWNTAVKLVAEDSPWCPNSSDSKKRELRFYSGNCALENVS
jgi:hypothetical protein